MVTTCEMFVLMFYSRVVWKADMWKKSEEENQLISNEPDGVTEPCSATEDTGESGCHLPAWIALTSKHLQSGALIGLVSEVTRMKLTDQNIH